MAAEAEAARATPACVSCGQRTSAPVADATLGTPGSFGLFAKQSLFFSGLHTEEAPRLFCDPNTSWQLPGAFLKSWGRDEPCWAENG